MPNGLQLLQNLTDGVAEADSSGALPPQTLRFVLEYGELPDLNEERDQIAELLGTESFELEFLFDEPVLDDDDDDGVFVIMQIPALERTTSRPGLFSISYALADELGLRSVEPDLGTDLFTEDHIETGPDGEGAVGGAIAGLCFLQNTPAPADHRWALKTIKADRAWDIATTRGAGILIGQPDTGVATHDELEAGSLDLARGIDIVDGDSDPTDPRTNGNAGHGTGTASVVISRDTNPLSGSAPAATVVPIRCIERVAVFNASPVARAIDHARSSGCHIVTMSLGGLPSWGLYRAVKRAVRNDMIVLAAAGNCVKTVVWPARFDDVIAVAGCNERLEPWRGTCRGDAVDVTAPAELVWRAQFDGQTGAPEIAGGQGTSFAVALTAGVAALWLGHHGIQHVIDEAARQGLSVQELFRRLLRETTHTPNGWDTDELGTGIVDAEALLQAPLDGSRSEQRTAGTLVPESVNERLGTDIDADDASIDWRRFNLEVASTVTEDLRRGAGPGVETSSQRVTAELRNALDNAGSEELRRLGQRSTGVRQPTGPTSGRRPDALPLVATSDSGGLESALKMSTAQARASFDDNQIEAKVKALKSRFDAAARIAPGAGLDAGRRAVLDDAVRVMQDMRDGKEIAPDDIGGRTSVEALVKLEGRPVIPLLNDHIDLNDPQLGAWQEQVAILAPALETARASVGRIDVNGVHSGTGFVVGPAHVLTNRHVVETMASAVPGHQNPDRWVLDGDATINFDPLAVDPDRQFRIKDIIFAGPDRILGSPISFSKLDLALLEVEETNTAGSPLPPALNISTDAKKTEAADKLLVLGYPAAPTDLPENEEGKLRMDVVNRLNELFGLTYSVQYLSPGTVLEDVAEVTNSPRNWVFSHDATSLGGNSGSCIFTFDRAFTVSGLHFAGDWLRANFAHDFAALNADAAALPDAVRAVLFGGANP